MQITLSCPGTVSAAMRSKTLKPVPASPRSPNPPTPSHQHPPEFTASAHPLRKPLEMNKLLCFERSPTIGSPAVKDIVVCIWGGLLGTLEVQLSGVWWSVPFWAALWASWSYSCQGCGTVVCIVQPRGCGPMCPILITTALP